MEQASGSAESERRQRCLRGDERYVKSRVFGCLGADNTLSPARSISPACWRAGLALLAPLQTESGRITLRRGWHCCILAPSSALDCKLLG